MTADVFGDEEPIVVRAAGRYGQLIYTSFDDGSGSGGGWQVKDQIGDLTRSEAEELTARIVSKFDIDPPLPQYPTPVDIEGRPARLAYDAIYPAVGAYWHTVDAGTDGSGRPGNVFAHVVFDDAFSAQPALRPIELWDSPDWLRPYGPQNVRAARLPGNHLLRPGGVITVNSTLRFLLDPDVYRLGLYQVLLDAVYDAMTGGRSVVLLTDPADAAQWIGAVSYFMSPGTARRFSWSTYDKPDLALADAKRGVHLICVPREYAELPAADWIVIDAEEDPQLGALGGAGHALAKSVFPVAVSPWSLLAQAALVDARTASRVIELQDDIAREVGDRELSPVWPLAIAARTLELGDIELESAQAATDDHPAHLGSSERLLEIVDDLYAADTPQTPDDALRRLTRIRYSGGSQSRSAERLVICALRDSAWIAAPDIRFDLVPHWHNVEIDRLQGAVESWMQEIRRTASAPTHSDSEHLVLTVLRAGELLMRLARRGPELDEVLLRLADIIEIAKIDFLRDRPRVHAFISTVQNISKETLAAVLLPVLASEIRAPEGLDLTVWLWIFGDQINLDVQGAAEAPAFGVPNQGLLPLYITALLESPEVTDIPRARRSDLAHLGVTAVHALQASSNEEPVVEVERLMRHYTMNVEQLDRLIAQSRVRITPSTAFQHVFYSPPSAALNRVLDYVCHYPLREPVPMDELSALVVAGARVRTASTWTDFEKHWALTLMDSEVKRLVEELEPEVYGHLDENLCVPLGALFVAAQSRSRPWASGETVAKQQLALRLQPLQPQLVQWLERLIAREVIDIAWVAGESMRSRMGSDLAPTALFARPDESAGGSWMDSVIAGRLENSDYRGPTSVEALRDALWISVKDLTAPAAERFFLEYRSAGKEWLRERGLLTRDTQRSRFSLTHREDNT
ncbi:hypothetical protein DFJ75_3454 [Williamsia muralis]|uniref:Uncharacterized protein n=1 Tax=Williamsia marianensis TaxID=85044 RepID=A0A495K5Y7_WILMA|nr:hypothetical protein [Williamsia muralis]RKR96601.1 hypothetical protein DFJ75_3454 [Williamsia muralis]